LPIRSVDPGGFDGQARSRRCRRSQRDRARVAGLGFNGRWRQGSIGFQYFLGGWGGGDGGSLAAFSVINPALSSAPFVLTEIDFDLRGDNLYPSNTTLPGTLSISDFDYLSLVLRFSNADPAVSVISKSAIIRGSAFSAVDITPIPEPATLALWLAGLGVVLARRRSGA
jgi:hypothetical protein